MKTIKNISFFLALLVPITAFALKVHQHTDNTGHIITNISAAYSTTGVFQYVPPADTTKPVPYWQMTNTINTAINPLTAIVSGECDTNRTDILFSTNFTVNSVYVFQYSSVPQQIFLYTNAVIFDSFSFSSANATHSFSIDVGQFDRLGIASSNISTTVDFCFQGRRN